jgi:hypothetical protein
MADLYETAVIKITYPALNIASMIVRVVSIDRGSLADGQCIINVVEDVFATGYTSYATPPAAGASDASETSYDEIDDTTDYSQIVFVTQVLDIQLELYEEVTVIDTIHWTSTLSESVTVGENLDVSLSEIIGQASDAVAIAENLNAVLVFVADISDTATVAEDIAPQLNDVNCRLWYKLNDDAPNTTVVDDSGYNVDGTLQGGDNTEDINIAGHISGALQFDGSADYFDANQSLDSVFQDSFSVCLWLKPDDGNPIADQNIWGVQLGGTDVAKLYLGTTGKLNFNYIADSNGLTFGTTNPVFSDGPAGSWLFVVCTADSSIGGPGGLKIYIQGTLDNTASTAGITFADFATGLDLFVGGLGLNLGGGLNAPFDGGIDNIMVFDHALSEAEILWLWNNGNGREELFRIRRPLPRILTGV